jgi:hypothetical protein
MSCHPVSSATSAAGIDRVSATPFWEPAECERIRACGSCASKAGPKSCGWGERRPAVIPVGYRKLSTSIGHAGGAGMDWEAKDGGLAKDERRS